MGDPIHIPNINGLRNSHDLRRGEPITIYLRVIIAMRRQK